MPAGVATHRARQDRKQPVRFPGTGRGNAGDVTVHPRYCRRPRRRRGRDRGQPAAPWWPRATSSAHRQQRPSPQRPRRQPRRDAAVEQAASCQRLRAIQTPGRQQSQSLRAGSRLTSGLRSATATPATACSSPAVSGSASSPRRSRRRRRSCSSTCALSRAGCDESGQTDLPQQLFPLKGVLGDPGVCVNRGAARSGRRAG
jgi:hypothetical protein